MIHSLSGAQGTGKTTRAHQLAADLMKSRPGKTVGLVVDVERRCPYLINRQASRKAQEWIFFSQIAAELHALAIYDLVVSDRSIMDVIAYSMVAGFKVQADDMLLIWQKYNHHYRRIMFCHTQTNGFNLADGCRDVDPVFRARVEATLLELYTYAGVTAQERFTVT